MRVSDFSVALAAAACLSIAAASASGTDSALLYDSQGRAATNAYVNDAGPFLFAIDTAAQISMLGRPVIEALKLEPDPDNKAQLHGAGGAATVSLYPVESLRIDGIERRNLLLPEPAHERESDAVGLVGADFFRGARLEFDFGDDRLSITDSADARADGFEIVPAQIVMGVFTIIDIDIDGVSATAIVDTGAINTIGNLALYNALGLTDDDPRISRDVRPIGVTGDALQFRDGFEAAFAFGEATVPSAPISFAPLHVFGQFGLSDKPALILGLDTLKKLDAFAIDYMASEFQARP